MGSLYTDGIAGFEELGQSFVLEASYHEGNRNP